jgi:hypothetical protein
MRKMGSIRRDQYCTVRSMRCTPAKKDPRTLHTGFVPDTPKWMQRIAVQQEGKNQTLALEDGAVAGGYRKRKV